MKEYARNGCETSGFRSASHFPSQFIPWKIQELTLTRQTENHAEVYWRGVFD